jgi:peroxiredoxin
VQKPGGRVQGRVPARLRFSRRVAPWLALVLLSGCAATLPPSAPSPLLGQALPDFRRPTLAHGDLTAGQLRGRPVVVKFFAEYCEPCKRTLGAAQRLSLEHADVQFVGVSEDEYAATAERVVKHHGLTFPVVLDRGHVLQGRFRVREMPVTFLADASGVVRWVGGPAQTEEELADALAAIR